ncbi:MAG: prefoldin subunit [Candidatus Aenigmatarchaeota archaeon]
MIIMEKENIETLQQNLQLVIIEIENLNLRKREIELVLDELSKSKEDTVFKFVGNVLVKRSKDEIIKELNDNKEIIDLRLKNLEKKKEELTQKLKELQKSK